MKRQKGVDDKRVSYVDSTEGDSRSRYGFVFFALGGLVSWTSTLAHRILTSSTEAECHGLVMMGKENVWIKGFFELGLFDTIPATTAYEDNKSAITLSTGGNQKRSKSFEIEFNKSRSLLTRRRG
jgi:hypothetical protein